MWLGKMPSRIKPHTGTEFVDKKDKQKEEK
jgi:hypothetical protein